MTNVDIPIPEELREVLSAPKCLDLSLPKPEKRNITLPSGGTLSALSNAGQNIPNDCSLTFSLMLQIAPLMASMDCVLKILKFLDTSVKELSNTPPNPANIIAAAADLAPCFLMLTPAGMIPFVRDLLCLILKALNCLIGALKTSLEFMNGLNIKLEKAQANDPPDQELIASLECAQENVVTSIGHLMQGMEPITAIMDLAGPFMSIAGVEAIQLPALGNAEDTEALTQTVITLEDTVATIQQVVDVLGGCPA